MEFFEWFSAPDFVLEYVVEYAKVDLSTAKNAAAFTVLWYIISIVSAAALFLVTLIFGGVGLSKMAKRIGLTNSWVSFLPFGNTYYAGKIAGDGIVFGKRIKKIGLICMLFEIVYVLMQTFVLVSNFLLVGNPAFYSRLTTEDGIIYHAFDSALLPDSMRMLMVAADVVNIISSVWYVVLIVLFCALYFALFRKYYARSPYLMTFLSVIFPVRGIVLFAVRNNTPIDYNDYMRRRMGEERRRYEEMYDKEKGNGQDGAPKKPVDDSPFPDFDASSGNDRDHNGPFSDF